MGFIFVIGRNFRPAIIFVQDGDSCMIRARRNLYFIHKYELQKELAKVPDNTHVLIDLSATSYVDIDNIDIINAFVRNAQFRNIGVIVRGDVGEQTASKIQAPRKEVVFA